MSYIEPRKVNHRDIADAANVSTATVSLALRNHPRIGVKTRERVKRIAAEMGYVNDAHLSSLMTYVRSPQKRLYTETIAYVYNAPEKPDINGVANNYHTVWQSAHEAAHGFGYELKLFNMQQENLNAARLSDILINRGIRGVYVAKVITPTHSLRMRWDKFTAITVGYSLRTPLLHRVARYHHYGARLAISHLMEKGYRRIGFAMPPSIPPRSHVQWLSGYLGALYTTEGCEKIPPYLSPLDKKTFKGWLDDNRPDVILGKNDSIYHMLEECGYACPQDIGFAHLNQFYSQIDCAGVVESPHELGEVAAGLLIGALHRNERGIPKSPVTTLVKGTWQDGPTIR